MPTRYFYAVYLIVASLFLLEDVYSLKCYNCFAYEYNGETAEECQPTREGPNGTSHCEPNQVCVEVIHWYPQGEEKKLYARSCFDIGGCREYRRQITVRRDMVCRECSTDLCNDDDFIDTFIDVPY